LSPTLCSKFRIVTANLIKLFFIRKSKKCYPVYPKSIDTFNCFIYNIHLARQLAESFRIGTATFIYYGTLDPMVVTGVEGLAWIH